MPTSVPLASALLPSASTTSMVLLPTSVVKPVTLCSLVLYTLLALLPVMVTVTASVMGVISKTPGVWAVTMYFLLVSIVPT